MQSSGFLSANEEYLFCEDDFREAYDWMAEQMTQRIYAAPEGIKHPVWAWYQWDGKHKRPDMRSFRKWSNPGTPIVLLTVDIPDSEVLLSDFDTWHIVMSKGYCPVDDADLDYMDVATPEEVVASWERIFLPLPHDGGVCSVNHVQATIWQIKKEWVIKAEHFVSA